MKPDAASSREELDGEIFAILKATFPGNARGVAQALSCIRNLIAQPEPVKAGTPEWTTEKVIEDVLDAASAYMQQQYGNGALSHPLDRSRIRAALSPTPRS